MIESLGKVGPVRPLLFGYTIHGTGETEGEGAAAVTDNLLKNFTADEARTCLADAIHEIMERNDGAPPAGIVLVTDGQDNASKYSLQEAGLACARRQVPLHIYGVGTAQGASLQLKEVGVPETLFVDDTITVPLRWRSQGLGKGKLAIQLTLGGKVVAQREIDNATGDDVRSALEFTVPKGKQTEESVDLVATLTAKGKEVFRDTLTESVRVVDRKIRVLYIEHSARFVYQFLMAALLRDRRIEATFLLVNADPKLANAGPPFLPAFPPTRAQFFDAHYNVIILGDVAASYLGNEHMEWIKEFVQNRGGMIAIAGRQHMPSTYVSTPLADVLPAEFEPKRFSLASEARTEEYPVTLSEIGRRTDMLALADSPEKSLAQWAKLPGFHWQYPLLKLRPGAVSLLVNPRLKMGEQPMPLLTSQYYGQGQVLFLGSDETWRWRFNEADKLTNRFWGQLIYQVGLPSLLGQSSKRAQIALAGSKATLNVPDAIFARLLDKNFNPRKDAKVEAVLEYLDAKAGEDKTRTVAFHRISGRDGEYSAVVSHDRPGRWELRINNPEPNVFRFRVDMPPRHEMEEAGLAEAALRELRASPGANFTARKTSIDWSAMSSRSPWALRSGRRFFFGTRWCWRCLFYSLARSGCCVDSPTSVSV